MLYQLILTCTDDASSIVLGSDRMPEGWQDLEINIARSAEQGQAVFFEFNTPELGLTFITAGYAFIKSKFDTFDVEVKIECLLEMRNADYEAWQEVYRGLLNMTTVEFNLDACECEIDLEQTGFLQTLNARYEETVDLRKTTSNNAGAVLDAYTFGDYNLTLHGKDIRHKALALSGTQALDKHYMDADLDETVSYNPDYSVEVANEFLGAFAPPTELDADIEFWQYIAAPTIEFYDWLLLLAGSLDFNIVLSVGAPVTIVINNVKLFYYIGTTPPANIGDFTLLAALTNPGSYTGTTGTTLSTVINSSLPTVPGAFQKNDTLYLVIQADINSTGVAPGDTVDIAISISDGAFDFRGYSLFPDTIVKAFAIHEAAARLLDNLTDGAISNGDLLLRSDLYGRSNAEPVPSPDYLVAGEGAFKAITSGQQIRGFTAKGIPTTLKDFVASLHAVDAAEIAVVRAAGAETIRLEKRTTFFDEATLLFALVEPRDMKLMVWDDELYGMVTVGFKEWAEEQQGGLDDPHTEIEYSTGLTLKESVLNKTEKVSPYFASAFVIERLRRRVKDFGSGNSVDGNSTDNDLDEVGALLCLKNNEGQLNICEKNERLASVTDEIYKPGSFYNFDITPPRCAKRHLPQVRNDMKPVAASGLQTYAVEWTSADVYDLDTDDPTATIDAGAASSAIEVYKKHILSFTAPTTLAQFRAALVNPFGRIDVQMPDGLTQRTFLKKMSYTPDEGVARYELILSETPPA